MTLEELRLLKDHPQRVSITPQEALEVVEQAIRDTRAEDARAARDQSKRYSCRKMKAVCRAIGDMIETLPSTAGS